MIQLDKNNQAVWLHTRQTSYGFRVLETGQLEHLYYGKRIHSDTGACMALQEKHVFAPGNSINYDADHLYLNLEDICLEQSSYGKGDLREPFLEITYPDGSVTSDFCFESLEKIEPGEVLNGLPESYGEEGEVECLVVHLRERHFDLQLDLYYKVFEQCDVICRSVSLRNLEKEPVQINRLMSLQLDLQDAAYEFHTFTGAWLREMRHETSKVSPGKHNISSYTGTSSNHANPFIMLARENTTEEWGGCFGFHLIYSGNHYEAVEESAHGKTRLVTGINPQSFSWKLDHGQEFAAPEAVMTFSAQGFQGMSSQLHSFINRHIVRGTWKNKVRPVLLNSWEAAYMDIDEDKLYALAQKAASVGVELFVMDDGWFGTRDDDTQSLGDWQVNKRKLPGGLQPLVQKVRDLGMEFGIWMEPEMVNVNSNLYRSHPEWVVEIPGRAHAEGRNQRILDLGQTCVQDFVIDSVSAVLEQAEITYVKWDMNRHFSDYYSKALPADRQGEMAHRYLLGLYRCMKVLTEKYPEVLFEGCAGGGNRFDLGILCYFPQIWASDNTDALCRAQIQRGYSYGYPQSCVSSHVAASPGHQTRRHMPMEARFAVAIGGVLGYELDLTTLSEEELVDIAGQIRWYKEHRKTLQYGQVYRGRNFGTHANTLDVAEDVMEQTVVAKDQSEAIGVLLQNQMVPNRQGEWFCPQGLEESARYRFTNVNLSRAHLEREEYTAYGDALMYGTVRLQQGHTWESEDGDLRPFLDYAARIYEMKKQEGEG